MDEDIKNLETAMKQLDAMREIFCKQIQEAVTVNNTKIKSIVNASSAISNAYKELIPDLNIALKHHLHACKLLEEECLKLAHAGWTIPQQLAPMEIIEIIKLSEATSDKLNFDKIDNMWNHI